MSDVFDLFARIGLDTSEYDKGLKNSESSFTDFGGKLLTGLKNLATTSAAVIGGAATAVSAFSTKVISSYAEYEQLVGGVDTLFGEASVQVQAYADKAYETAGLSANEYMETVTGFSAALIQSLGGDTQKAAEIANMALVDMSDNANKMGSDMASIQNAYQGFSKQNYTMLDNLKLGYGGTKSEMERLIEDANALREAQGLNNDLTIDSYADVVEAIHTVQSEMKITGTTQKEAATTISGSLGMVKSSWKNLITEIGKDDADISGRFLELSDSIESFSGNIIPRIGQVMEGIGTAVGTVVPVIITKLPELAEEIIPPLINATISLITVLKDTVTQYLPVIWNTLTDPENVRAAVTKITDLSASLVNAVINIDWGKIARDISNLIVEGINGIKNFFEKVDWEKLGNDLADILNNIDWHKIIETICSAIGAMFKASKDLVEGILDNIDFDSLASIAGIIFAPKLLTLIGSNIKTSDKFSEITGALSDRFGSDDIKGIGSTFGSTLTAGIGAFFVGWDIGTAVRNWIGPDKIDEVVWGIMDDVKDAFNRSTHLFVDDELDEAFNGGDWASNPMSRWYATEEEYLKAMPKAKDNRASGGIFTSTTDITVGEAGQEAVLPLENNLEWIDRLAEHINQSGGGTGGNVINVSLEGANISSDYDVDRLTSRIIDKVDERLRDVQIRSMRGTGGAWY